MMARPPCAFHAEGRAAVGQMWQRLARAPCFFRRLPWTRDGRTLWRFLAKQRARGSAAVSVLSGLPRGDWAAPQKRRWCARELGADVPVDLCFRWEKCLRAAPGHVLVDDSVDLREAWEAFGGRFVLHTSAAASVRELWQILHARPPKRERLREHPGHQPLRHAHAATCRAPMPPRTGLCERRVNPLGPRLRHRLPPLRHAQPKAGTGVAEIDSARMMARALR